MTRHCPHCELNLVVSARRPRVVRIGYFWRKSDGHWIQRFQCRGCGKTFSHATFSDCLNQNKRHMNEKVRKLLVEGVALRGIARTLKLSRKSVARKLLFLSFKAEKKDKEIKKTQLPCQIVEFDDLETCEGSKYRPLSVVLAVEHRRSRILGFKIASMPSKGRLSPDKKAKYLPREDERSSMRKKLFSEIRPLLHPMAVIKSDQNPHYRNDVRTYFPNSQHITFRGRKPAFTGQGEMKEGGFDPLFSLNHTFAMMRARMSRLIRKTWSISKKKENLRLHMNIYVAHHNQQLLDREVKKAGQSRSA